MTIPPEGIAGAVRDLASRDSVKRKAAVAALAKADDGEPYLRSYAATLQGRVDGSADDALAAVEKRRAARIAARVPDWVKAGRYDLLVDASWHLTTDEQVTEHATGPRHAPVAGFISEVSANHRFC